MNQNDQHSNRGRRGRNDNKNNDQSRLAELEWPPRQFRNAPVKAVSFMKEQRDGTDRIVSFLNMGDGRDATVFPYSQQFNPATGPGYNKPGKPYNVYCLELQRNGRFGPYSIIVACPALNPYVHLSMEEWLQPEDMQQMLAPRLVFRMTPPPSGNGSPRPFCKFRNKAVVPARGTEVMLNNEAAYLLKEEDTLFRAYLLTRHEDTFGSGLVKVAVGNGVLDLLALRYVVLRTATAKEGVARPTCEADVDVRAERRSIYDLLSTPRAKPPVLVDDSSDDRMIRKAFMAKARLLHPDGKGNAPFEITLNEKFYFKAFQEARDQALQLFEMRNKKPDAPEAPSSASEAVIAPPSGAPVVVPPAPFAEVTPPVAEPSVVEPPSVPPVSDVQAEVVKVDATAALAASPMEVDTLPEFQVAPPAVSKDDELIVALSLATKETIAVIKTAIENAKCSPDEFVVMWETSRNMAKYHLKAAKAVKPKASRA